MKKIIIISTIFLSGCASKAVPIVPDFPQAPKSLMEKCAPLKKINDGETLMSNVIKTIVENYSLYHQCAIKVDEWQKWYEEQKKIFDDID